MRKHNGHILTAEQDNAIDLALSENDLKIEAFAGSGKTFLLSAIGKEIKGKGLYVAFNKAIAEDAKSIFPSNVECRTLHSLAFASVGKKYLQAGKQLYSSFNAYTIQNYYDVNESVGDYSPINICSMVAETLKNYCYSTDVEISKKHFAMAEFENKDVIGFVVNFAKKIWAEMEDLNSNLNITHDFYLKKWALSKPRLKRDFVLLDEAQDTNPVVLGLLDKLNMQKIYVGDKYQQIYSWRKAVNAMQLIDTPHIATISKSFRFGQEIADVANVILNKHLKANVNIKGFEEIESTINKNKRADCILNRTNAGLINTIIDKRSRFDIKVNGGVADVINLLKGIEQLKDYGSSSHPELVYFKNYNELKEFSQSDNGQQYKALIAIIEHHGIDYIIEILSETENNKYDYDLVVSTAHKSKGQQWENVKIEDDFFEIGHDNYTPEDSNLLYVACTRAIGNLDIKDCKAVYSFKEKEEEIESVPELENQEIEKTPELLENEPEIENVTQGMEDVFSEPKNGTGALVGYKRVSSVGQNSERQLSGLKLDKVFEDKASGSNADRPALIECMGYLRDGDTLFVHSIDRLARNLSDLLNTIQALLGKGVSINFLKENLVFKAGEQENPFQKLQLQIMGSVAEFERTLIRERQREGIAKAKAQNKHLGRPKKIKPGMYEDIKKMLDDGMSKKRVAGALNISVATLYRILKENK